MTEKTQVLCGIERVETKIGKPSDIVLQFVGLKIAMSDHDQRSMIRWMYRYKPELVKHEIESMDKMR